MTKKQPATRHVAFLRGINVGGHRVKMDVLRELFAALGFANVATYIASGNVIFETIADAALEARVEAHLKASLGYAVDTHIRTPSELASIAAFRPFESADTEVPGHTVHVAFLRSEPNAQATRAILTLRTEMDEFRIQGREMYWLCRGKITDSKVSWPLVSKVLGGSSTMRNVTTVRKLAALYPA